MVNPISLKEKRPVACPGGVLWVLKHPARADPKKKKKRRKKEKGKKKRKGEREGKKESKPVIMKNIRAPYLR